MAELLVEIGLNLSFPFQKVEEVMSENVGSTEPCSSLPKTTSVARAANHHRSKNRPKHPTTLDFELLDDYVPSQFLCGDVHKNGTRHLIFATDAQLEFLTNAKTWYVDATFKVIKQPFTQLFSVHAFVVVVKTTSACSVLLSPRFHVDHMYKPLCPTLKHLAKHPSSRSTVRINVRRARQPCVSSNDGIAIFTCRCHCQRVPDLAYCVRRPVGCTASAVHGAPPPGRLLPGQSSVSRCGPITTWRAGIVY